ncbi:MAG TPA: helix-turn-helix transcriptional regulator [Thermoanaerobaculia bacterium]|jgi:transcriptional regulator with XRE-family HTH domain|nr:helix-turn-helix transcriptional regulator [Thermoanaerobaculia bacterium]
MEKPTAHLIQFLKSSVAALGFTQTQLEERMGQSKGYVSRLFNGQIDLKVDHVAEIARALRVDPFELFRLAFHESPGEPSLETRRLQQMVGLMAPESPPETLSELEKDIERIVQRVLDRRQGS